MLVIALVVALFLLTCGARLLHAAPRPNVARAAKHKTKNAHILRVARIVRTIRVARPLNFVHVRYPDFRGVAGPDGPLAAQNRIADEHGLTRIQFDWMIGELVLEGNLVPIKTSEWLEVDPRLEEEYQFIAPEAAKYIEDLPGRLRSIKLKITSLVRSEEYQRFLATKWIVVNGKRVYNKKYARNATLCEKGGTSRCSIHTTTYGFDLSTRGLTKSQILTIAAVFKQDKKKGLVELIYEPKQNHFHVFYIPQREIPGPHATA